MSNFWVDVYKLQYERIAEHERQRLTFSNMIAVLSVAIFGFYLSSPLELTTILNIWLAVVIIIINVFGIFSVIKSRQWIKFHQSRARKILKEHDQKLHEFFVNECKPNSDKDNERRPVLYVWFHLAIILLSVALIIIKTVQVA